MIRLLLASLLAIAAACAQAGTGVTQVDSTDGPVTVFYPTAANDAPVTLLVDTATAARTRHDRLARSHDLQAIGPYVRHRPG